MRIPKNAIFISAGFLAMANLILGGSIVHTAVSVCTALALTLFLYTEETINLKPANHVVTGAMPLLLMLNIIAASFSPEAIYPFTFSLFFIADFFIFRKTSIRTGIFSGIIVYFFSFVVIIFLVEQIPAIQPMIFKHLSGPSNPGTSATVFLNAFVIAATIVVFFFEPRQRGFIHTYDLIRSEKKLLLTVTNSLLRTSLLFIVYSMSGLASIPLSLWASYNKSDDYLPTAVMLCAWFEMLQMARHFGFENGIVIASVIIGFVLYFARSRRSKSYDQRSRSLIFSLRQRSSL